MLATRGFYRPMAVGVLLLLLAFSAACGRSAPPKTPPGGKPVPGGAGKPQLLSFTLDTDIEREPEARAIAAQLTEYGVDVQVQVWSWPVLMKEIQAGNRTAYLTSWGSAFYDPFDLAAPKLRTGDRGNYSFFGNEEFDRVMTAAVVTADAARRTELYARAQDILKAEAPWVFGYYTKAVSAATENLLDWAPRPDGRIYAQDLAMGAPESEEKDSGGPGSSSPPPDTLVVALPTSGILALDPTDYRDRETETVLRNIFDGLVNRTRHGKVVPEIARSWEVDDNGATFTFHLRDDVVFHDGTPLTAHDVAFTFRKIYGLGEFSAPTARAGLVLPSPDEPVQVIPVDDHTVRFRFARPFPVFLQGLVHQQIIPAEYFQRIGPEEFARHPVGAGPFRFAGGEPDGEISLERFPGYYGGSPELPPVGPARLARVVFRMMPDAAARVAALRRGEVHLIQQVPGALVKELQSVPGVQVKFAEGTTCYALELNNSRPPFDDGRVRVALNHAINWEPILMGLYGGLAARLPTAFLPNGWGFSPEVEAFPHDPARAVELLEEAGFQAHLPAGP